MVTQKGETFHFWRVKIKKEMPAYDGPGNPLLWFGKRDGGEIEVCGVKTLREAKEFYGVTI
jgi:hypothetical protein